MHLHKLSALLTAAALTAACGDDGNGGTVDARAPIDASATPDAPTGGTDADTTDAPVADAATADAATADAEPMADATPTDGGTGGGPGVIWVGGDPFTNNVDQFARMPADATLPHSFATVLPLAGETSSGDHSADLAPYDISADGSFVVWAGATDTANQEDLVYSLADGTGVRRVVQAVSTVLDIDLVSISPDGTKIAFRADLDIDGAMDLYVVDASLTDATPIKISPNRDAGAPTPIDLDVDYFSWDRTSSYVAFTMDLTDEDYYELHVADVANLGAVVTKEVVGRADILVSSGTTGVNDVPRWAADGRLLFKGRIAADGTFRLYASDVTVADPVFAPLTNSQRMRPDNSTADVGAWGLSEDGTMIAFAADDLIETGYEVYVMPSADDTAATRITDGAIAASGEPAFFLPLFWSPDGTMVAFSADYAGQGGLNEPYVAAVSGGGQRRLATIPGTGSQDSVELAWSRDSATLYMIADIEANNESELFRLDPAMTDQTPVEVFDVTETNADVKSIRSRP